MPRKSRIQLIKNGSTSITSDDLPMTIRVGTADGLDLSVTISDNGQGDISPDDGVEKAGLIVTGTSKGLKKKDEPATDIAIVIVTNGTPAQGEIDIEELKKRGISFFLIDHTETSPE